VTIQAPFPDLDEIIFAVGEAGRRLSEIDATEGAAGNITVYFGWSIDPRRKFPIAQTIELPTPIPAFAGKTFLATGSGRRLREIVQDPSANLGFVVVNEGGTTGELYTSPRRLFQKLTSEFNSHLAVHFDQIQSTGTNFHAVIHAQPPHLTFLSHIPRYQDERYLNRHILRWEPELIVNLPEGLGHVPFLIPGSSDLMAATVNALRVHRIAIWGKHGVIARSDQSVKRAADRIEYAEAGARYEYMNLSAQEIGAGLSEEEIRAVCQAFGIQQEIF
jgi:rhamnulose-1-phosphate aldolase